MAYIEKRERKKGKPSYRVLVRMKGHPSASASFLRKTDALRWAQDTESAIRQGRYFKSAEAKKHTLAELIDRYVKDVLPHRPKGEKKTRALLQVWRDEFGDYTLARVTPALIGEKRDELARGTTYRGTKRSPATCNRYLQALSHPFSVAVNEWGWCDENPVRKVRRLPESRGRVRFLDEDERERLLQAARESTDSRLYPMLVLALSTGARQSELLRLRWRDLDFERGVAILHETKNNERRAIPIAGHAHEVLRKMSKVRRLDTDLILASAKSTKARFPQKAWERALEAARIEDYRWHDNRHSAASYLAANGATLAELAEVLGHKTLAMVKRYSHLTEQHTSKVVARMNEAIFGGS
ncbi:MAG: site-specific integrase [Armatimonadetes bacterium]|nr:site-specific integrase [Armatimonadota bacterium]